MSNVFNWNESFLVGISQVDDQHKKLVDLINDLGEIALNKEVINAQKFREASNAMLDYAKVHFRDEEALMKSAGLDPNFIQNHHFLHRTFFEEARAWDTYNGQLSPQQAKQLLNYLVDWLAYHILGTDHSMARQIKAVQAGQSAEQAYQAEAEEAQTGTEPLLTALKGLFETVSQRNQELRKLNQTLEQKVEERTAELKQANRKLEALAVNDELTGLPNRRFAMSLLNKLWAEAETNSYRFSVLLLDADKFKQVNDIYGHAEGDALLQSIAVTLQEAVRNDDTVCRLGGDEFLVICPGCSENEAALVAEKILNAQKEYCNSEGVVCWNGAVSIGFAQAQPSMHRPEDLLKKADQALYVAKRKGGSQAASAHHALNTELAK
jgi:hemerythrin